MKGSITLLANIALFLCACNQYDKTILTEVEQPVLPVITHKETNSVLKLTYIRKSKEVRSLKSINLSLNGTSNLEDIEEVALFAAQDNGLINSEYPLSKALPAAERVNFKLEFPLTKDTTTVWVSMKLNDRVNLLNKVNASLIESKTNKGSTRIKNRVEQKGLRLGVAVRKHKQDGVHTSRIPGLVKTNKGTLIAVYDARWNSSRDIQGDVDICIQRSFDGGITWTPQQVVLDRGEWGGLPDKFNGVGDANILVDKHTGAIFIAATWMYGVIDSQTGEFIEGLTEESTQWSHEWFGKGSQPGFGVKETAQFLMTHSVDDGETWSEAENLTSKIKNKEWWLYAPAPGAGITMDNGFLVMPTQGRDNKGVPFSNFMYSTDHGKSWQVAKSPSNNTTECNIVQLDSGELMLNMRDNRNAKRGTRENPDSEPSKERGRAIAVTNDMGNTWEFHSTHHKALIEPLCMACLYKFNFNQEEEKKSVILFSNPNSKENRTNITIKASLDDGNTWPQKYWILLDEYQGRGYSSMTAVNDSIVGILYESSQADLVFQQIHVKDIVPTKHSN